MTADTRADAHSDTAIGSAAFSRPTGLPASLGKCAAPLKTLVPDSVADDFRRLCRELDMTDSEVLRELVMVRTYGLDVVQSMQRQRLAMVAGIVPNSTQPRPEEVSR